MNIENIQHPYGLLLNQDDLKLHRKWFDEMVRLIGVQVIYRGIREGKKWTTYAEIDSNYYEPICIGCIFNEYPDQKTMKKLGWVSQTDQQASIISVPFDTPHIQVGSLFIIPNALNPKQGRLFRVSKMSTLMIAPASVTCELVPEYEDTLPASKVEYYKQSSFNLLNKEEDGSGW